jgi:hypothetical protein
MKDPGIYVDPPWEKCSKEHAWRMKDKWMGFNKKNKYPFEYQLLKEHR